MKRSSGPPAACLPASLPGRWLPQMAYTYNLQDEYWLKAGTAFSTVFAGADRYCRRAGHLPGDDNRGVTGHHPGNPNTPAFITSGTTNHFYKMHRWRANSLKTMAAPP